VATTDKEIGKIFEICKKEGYVLFVTSDHGYYYVYLKVT
jgi:2,3-bisphosphoglycerate-independent phosphoglycerate mutase